MTKKKKGCQESKLSECKKCKKSGYFTEFEEDEDGYFEVEWRHPDENRICKMGRAISLDGAVANELKMKG